MAGVQARQPERDEGGGSAANAGGCCSKVESKSKKNASKKKEKGMFKNTLRDQSDEKKKRKRGRGVEKKEMQSRQIGSTEHRYIDARMGNLGIRQQGGDYFCQSFPAELVPKAIRLTYSIC